MPELTTPGSDLDGFLYAFWPLIQRVVLSRTTELPGSPTDGDTYIVPSDDLSNPNEIAVRKNGAWAYRVPTEGWRAYVLDDSEFVTFDGSDWVPDASSGVSASQTFMLTGLIETAADGDYRIAANIPFAMTITKVTTRSASGTCTLTTKINTTALGGTANSVSTSEQSQTHASSNAASVGDDIVLTVSSNSAALKVTVTIEYTRTLA